MWFMPETCQKSVDMNQKTLWFMIPHIEVIIYAHEILPKGQPDIWNGRIYSSHTYLHLLQSW